MTRLQFVLLTIVLTVFVVVVSQIPRSEPRRAIRCSIYSGIVMNASNRAVQLWHGPFCSITVVSASRASTCQTGEFYDGYTCPDNGGGGGDSW